MGPSISPATVVARPMETPPETRLRKVAVDMEAAFLTEMLKHAGYGNARDAFGGGAGEEQFGSFLREAQARSMAESGGIGLAEHIFESLKERTHASGE